jgi:hypothetical protein
MTRLTRAYVVLVWACGCVVFAVTLLVGIVLQDYDWTRVVGWTLVVYSLAGLIFQRVSAHKVTR